MEISKLRKEVNLARGKRKKVDVEKADCEARKRIKLMEKLTLLGRANSMLIVGNPTLERDLGVQNRCTGDQIIDTPTSITAKTAEEGKKRPADGDYC